MNRSQVRQKFLDRCVPIRPGGTWPEQTLDADCFLCPQYGCATLASLSEEFFEWELVTAGIAKCTPDGLVINDVLHGDAGGVLALRRLGEKFPYALLTAKGVVSDERVPVLSVLEDEQTRQRMDAAGGRLIVARNMVDLMVLRSIGLPATLAADLGDRTESSLLQIAMRCGWDVDASVINASLPDLDVTAAKKCQTEVAQTITASVATSTAEEADAPLPPCSEPLTSIVSSVRPPERPPLELVLAEWSVANLDGGGHEPLINWLGEAE